LTTPGFFPDHVEFGSQSEETALIEIILAPDIYVNASLALGSPPEQVVRRVLGARKGGNKTSEWILSRVRQMLRAVPAFKDNAVEDQVNLIRGLVHIIPVSGDHGPDAWADALVAAARAAGATRVVTDHPDLLSIETAHGIEFMSSEAWLVEAATPPPAPVQTH
jgi:hypothetical protein